jgi:hypothetical protein
VLRRKREIANREAEGEHIMSTITIKVPNWLDMVLALPVIIYRRWKYGFIFRRIFLGEGFYAIVDLSDYYLLNKFRWSAKRDRNWVYAVRFVNDPASRGKTISLHRFLLNPPPHLLVDHRNGITLDNRRVTLRLATRLQNVQNKGKTQAKTSSKYIGVCLEKRTGCWDVRIRPQGKRIWIGRFVNEIEAARAYDEAAKKYHGEFARLNFPEDTRNIMTEKQMRSIFGL